MSLSRQICASIADENRNIYGITLDAATVAKIQKALDSEESTVTIKGGFLKKTFKNIENILKTSHVDIENTAVIVPLEIRQIVFHIVEQFIPNLSVIANQELSSEFNVEIIGEA